ncbi:MAG TPA: DUF2970 domain-containing protein [Casimicrobiaceae bacterium]|nr:DUF2970 domain-containing protein [Casimicrobiaceae bacterium]
MAPADAPSDPEPPASKSEPKSAPLRQVVGAVFWSFFGVRKGKDMQRDEVSIKPLQVIVVGVALAALIVLALIALVKVVLFNAAH